MKEKVISVKYNVIYQMLYELLALALPLITSPYVSRVLGAEKVGIYSYTYSIATYFGMFAMLGIKNYGNREIAKSRDSQEKVNQNFTNIYTLQLIMSLTVILFYVLYVLFCVKEYKMYFLIQFLYVISCMLDINWFYLGIEQVKLTVARNTFIKLFTFIGIFIFVREPGDLWKYCLIISVGTLISQIIVWAYIPHFVEFVKPDFNKVFFHLKPMFLLFIPVLAVSLYNVMDKIMIGLFSTKTQLGYYENSEKIINCVKTVITAFGTVMMPRMSRLASQNNKVQSRKYMILSMEVVMCISFALAFGIAAVARLFAPIYWGYDFTECSSLLLGLSITLPFSGFANVIRTQYLIPNNMDKIYIISVLSGASINLVVNCLLIATMGAMGAVVGTIAAEGAVAIVQAVAIRKQENILEYINKGIPFLIFGTVMLIVVKCINVFLPHTIFGLLIEICCGGIIYCILCVIYFYVTKNAVLYGVMRKILHK